MFKKILIFILILIGVTFVTFSITKALPGDPVLNLVGERAQPEVIDKLRKELGINKDVFSQYFSYVKLLARGEFGRSYYTNRKVFDDLLKKFPNTLMLSLTAMIIAVPSGMFLGFICAWKKDKWIDKLFSFITLMGLSIPVFWGGLVIMLLFSLKFKLFPPSGTGNFKFIFLPALTLSIPAMSMLSRVTKTTLIDIFGMPYINTARSKGISEIKVNLIHVTKNALIPIITVIGLDFASYINGAVLTETIFGWDGIGRFIMEGILKRDYPVIMGCVIIGTFAFVIINTLVDLIYHFIDPRVSMYEIKG
ncbi:MAG: ABC transporter permease [Nitrospirae bacterium]|nr:ABC transporter permease [Nitrospirota bacterium]